MGSKAETPDRFDITMTLDVRRVEKAGVKIEDKDEQEFFHIPVRWKRSKLPGVLAMEAIGVKGWEIMVALGFEEAAGLGFQKAIEQLRKLLAAPPQK